LAAVGCPNMSNHSASLRVLIVEDGPLIFGAGGHAR
jgi:hypothetical protein